MSLRVGEGLAGAAAARMAVRRLREAAGTMLRQRRTGQTPKDVLASHPVLDGRTDIWNISCDGRPSDQPSAQLLFDTAWLLADEGTSRRELRAVAADLKAEMADENRIERRALHAAVTDLLGSGHPPDHRQPDLVADLHPEAVRLAWIDALATAVWLVPAGEAAPEGSGPSTDELVPMPKKGSRYRAVDPADPAEIVLGEFVVAEVTSPTTGTVVPFRSCEGLVDLDGGMAIVVDANGESFVIDPAAWVDGQQLLADPARSGAGRAPAPIGRPDGEHLRRRRRPRLTRERRRRQARTPRIQRADALERRLGRRELEVHEAVGLAGVADLVDVDPVLPQAGGVGPTLVAQEVAAAEDDQRRRQAGQARRAQRCCVGIVVEVAAAACTRPRTPSSRRASG